MNITQIQIHLTNEPNNKVKAFADIILDEEFIVRGLAIREDNEGFCFVTMPYRIKDDIRHDMAHPIKESCRRYIQNRVLDKYEWVLNEMAKQRLHQEGSILKPYNPYLNNQNSSLVKFKTAV